MVTKEKFEGLTFDDACEVVEELERGEKVEMEAEVKAVAVAGIMAIVKALNRLGWEVKKKTNLKLVRGKSEREE